MNKNLILLGSMIGLAGIIVCAVAGLARVAGHFYLLGFQSMTVFNIGVGLMVFGCFVKLQELAARNRS